MSAVCNKHCMTVTSRLYRSAVGRSAIPYCNSGIVIKISGRQLASVNKLYDSCHQFTGLLLCICQLPTCVPPTCPSMFTDYRQPVYHRPAYLCPLTTADLSTADLSYYYYVSANCLHVYHGPAHLWPLTTTDLSTADLSITLYLPTAYLSSTDLSTYVNWRHYCWPVFLLLCICKLPTYLPLTCPPRFTDYIRPVYCLPIPMHLPTAYLSTVNLPTDYHRPTVYLSFYYFVSANCLPVYRRPVHLGSLTTADLSTIYLSSYLFASANCLPVYRWPAHWLPPTCLPSICLPSPFHLPTAYLSTADLPTYVH